MVHPLCGYPLDRGTIFLAGVQMVLSVAFLVQNSISLAFYVPRALEEREINSNAESWVEKVPRIYSTKSTILLLSSTYWICNFLLGTLLYLATKQRDLRKCRQWFILTCILAVLFIVDFMMEAFSMTATAPEVIAPVTATLLLFYMIWVVLTYMDELRLGGCVQIKTHSEIPH